MSKKIIMSLIVLIIIITAIVYFNKSSKDTGGAQISTSTPSQKLSAGSATTTDPILLQNSTWVWQQTVLDKGYGPILTRAKSDVFSINFSEEGRITGKTDCNSFFGNYKVGSDGVINFDAIGATEMYCKDSQETEFTSTLSRVKRYTLNEYGTLILLLNNNTGWMTFKKQ